MKEKVFVYGIANIHLRKDIEQFLDDAYEITGYADYNYTEDDVYGKPFVPLEELHKKDFAYVIMAIRQKCAQAEIRDVLLKQRIPTEKIILPTMLLHLSAEQNQLDLVAELDGCKNDAQALIFGLSYSLRGIIKSQLPCCCYDFSWHGLDLYYNFRLYEYALAKGLFAEASEALLVFPYYYFNYDASRSLYQYTSGQMFSVRRLDDWHNHYLLPESKDYIANYRLFGEKIARQYHFERFQYQTRRIYSGAFGSGRLDNIWFTHNEATITEN